MPAPSTRETTSPCGATRGSFAEVFSAVTAAFAEYACAPEGVFGPKPTNLSFEQAAAVPTAALTALQGLRNTGEVRPGQKILVNGASGGVGTFVVQMARVLGAEVTGVCSGRNADLVRSLGADHVIDYTREDFPGPERSAATAPTAPRRRETSIVMHGRLSGGALFPCSSAMKYQ